MKKIFNTIFAGLVALQIAMFASSVQAAEVKEIKQTHNGITLNANLMMADGKTFADDIVLLTHGTLTHKDRSTYAQLQKNLAGHGISSLAINLSLGLSDRHGEYDCAVPHIHKHTDALKEIDFWLNWLQKQGAKNITLMGHSRGGNQTAWYSIEHDSNAFKKVVLLAPATGGQQAAEDYQKKYGKPLQPILDKANKLVAEGKGDTMLKDIDFIYCKKAQVTAAAFADYYNVKPQFNTIGLLKGAKKDTLVIIGSADTVEADLPEKMKQLADSDKVQTVTIEDATHFFLDFANEDVATAVAEFIEQ
ncbi:alpha/beta hydrolase [Thiomicrorhabdus sp.]|uniref:alpha/beta hydrolase n=1 Tax=Thiomicrorhabdus sp. TaxID=2039724 RepID=UPI002AA95D99|nr:alpha/beta hydrolase [Thiomicrorhabdus sp.]